VEGLTQLRFEARRPGVVLVLLGYLALLALGELAVTFANPLLVFPFHGGLILLAGTHLAILERRPADERPSPALVALLLAFIIAPLIRIISLTLPLAQIEAPYRYLFAGVPMMIGAVLVARATGLRWRDIGIVWRAPSWQIMVVIASLGLGFVEFGILRPAALGGLPWTAAGFLPALSVGVFTGFPEELIFRGIMQTAARPVLGRWNWVYVSAIFAVLHIGYRSFIDFAFVLGVGLLYGWVFERTRSIVGVSVGHGLANVVLFFVAPHLVSTAALRPLTTADELFTVTLAAAAAATATIWFLIGARRNGPGRIGAQVRAPMMARWRERPGLMPLGPTQTAIVADPAAGAAGVVGRNPVAVPLLLSATAKQEFATSGQAVRETSARGIVRLRSENTLHDVPMPAGTRLGTDLGVEFATTTDVVISRASFQVGPTVVDAVVEAVVPGPEANVEAGSVTTLPAEFVDVLVSAWNPEPMSGGLRTDVTFVTEQDYARALGALPEQLDLELATELEEEARQTNLRLFPSTVRWAESIVEPGSEVVGQPGPTFTVRARQMATVTGVDETALADEAGTQLEKQIAQGYELIPGSIHVRMGEPVVGGQSVTYEVEALGEQRLLDVDAHAPPERSRLMWFAALALLVAGVFVAAILSVLR
jgi:CAAX protease family protein